MTKIIRKSKDVCSQNIIEQFMATVSGAIVCRAVCKFVKDVRPAMRYYFRSLATIVVRFTDEMFVMQSFVS